MIRISCFFLPKETEAQSLGSGRLITCSDIEELARGFSNESDYSSPAALGIQVRKVRIVDEQSSLILSRWRTTLPMGIEVISHQYLFWESVACCKFMYVTERCQICLHESHHTPSLIKQRYFKAKDTIIWWSFMHHTKLLLSVLAIPPCGKE